MGLRAKGGLCGGNEGIEGSGRAIPLNAMVRGCCSLSRTSPGFLRIDETWGLCDVLLMPWLLFGALATLVTGLRARPVARAFLVGGGCGRLNIAEVEMMVFDFFLIAGSLGCGGRSSGSSAARRFAIPVIEGDDESCNG